MITAPRYKQTAWTVLLLITFATPLFLLLTDRAVTVYDGSMVALQSYRMMMGDAPHRDFYNSYGPLPFVALSGMYSLFGVSMWMACVANTVSRTLTVALVYLVMRRVGTQGVAVAVAIAFFLLLSLTSVPSVAFASMPVLLLAAAVSAGAFTGERRFRHGILIGLLAGLMTLYRYEQGPVVLAVDLLTLLLGSALWALPVRTRMRRVAESFATSVAVYAACLGCLLLSFRHWGMLHDLLDQLNFLRLHFASGRSLPFSIPLRQHPEQVIMLFPLIVPPVTLGYVVWCLWRRRDLIDGIRSGSLAAFSGLALILSIKGSVRVDFWQMALANMAVLMLLGTLLCGMRLHLRMRQFSVAAALVMSLALLRIWQKEMHRLQHEKMTVAQSLMGATAEDDEAAWCSQDSPLTRPVCFLPDADHRAAVSWLLPHLRKGERLYVGLPRHDVIFANDHLTYFATWARPAVKWEMFESGLQNSAPVQRDMVRDLQRWQPAYVVEDAEFDAVMEPNDSSKSSGVTLLDDYIRTHYDAAARFGELTILARNSASR